METCQSFLSLAQPYCYMTTVDLKDTCYSAKIDKPVTAYLLFYLSCLVALNVPWFCLLVQSDYIKLGSHYVLSVFQLCFKIWF